MKTSYSAATTREREQKKELNLKRDVHFGGTLDAIAEKDEDTSLRLYLRLACDSFPRLKA